jgi:WD40 repeat protein
MKFFISHIFFLNPTVSYLACRNWYVSCVTPLYPMRSFRKLQNGLVRIWNVFDRNSIFPRVTLRGHKDSVCSVYFSRDEKLLATLFFILFQDLFSCLNLDLFQD